MSAGTQLSKGSFQGEVTAQVDASRGRTKAKHKSLILVCIISTMCRRNDDYLHQTAPEKAISTLNAFVLFSVLSPAFIPSRIPTMIMRINISPMEETVNEMFETLFLDRDSKAACSSALEEWIRRWMSHSKDLTFYPLVGPLWLTPGRREDVGLGLGMLLSKM
jgi:hypothetical protein